MAYTDADYRMMMSSRTVFQLREEAIWLPLTTQDADTQAWVNGDNSVDIPKPDWAPNNSDPTKATEGVQAVSRDRGGDWAKALEGDQDILEFKRSGGFSTSNKIKWEDAIELPWPVVEQTRARQQYVMNQQFDHAIYGKVLAGIAAGDTKTVGTKGSISLSIAGVQQGAIGKAIWDAIKAWNLTLETKNVNSVLSDAVGQKYVVMRPECYEALSDYFESADLHWDELTRDLLVNNTLLAARGFRGRLRGIDIISWNGITPPATAGDAAANQWPIVCGVAQAWKADVRAPIVQVFTPETNQVSSNPSHLLRQAADYATLEIDGSLMRRLNVRSQ